MPVNFKSNNQWSYVNFKGSSIKELKTNSFKNLNLNKDATVIFSNIEKLNSDIFINHLIYDEKFRFVIEDSKINSLNLYYPFRFLNFSQFEFKNCSFQDEIYSLVFEGSRIDTLIIDHVQPQSESPYFRTYLLSYVPKVRKLKIANALNTFSINSPAKLFGLDIYLLDFILFQSLEELEIVNTQLDFVESDTIAHLQNLRILRLENVNLKNVIEFYFDRLEIYANMDQNGEINFRNENINWISNKNLKKIYLGREVNNEGNFQFEDEYLCYFAGLNEQTKIYIYDSLDTGKGINCTCSVLWIYRYLDFDNIKNDADSKYIPSCIKNLNNSQNLETSLRICLRGMDPLVSCKYLSNKTTTQSIIPTTSSTIPVSKTITNQNIQSKTSTVSTKEIKTTTTTTITSAPLLTSLFTNNFNLDDIKSKLDFIYDVVLALVIILAVFFLFSFTAIALTFYFNGKNKKTVSNGIIMDKASKTLNKKILKLITKWNQLFYE